MLNLANHPRHSASKPLCNHYVYTLLNLGTFLAMVFRSSWNICIVYMYVHIHSYIYSCGYIQMNINNISTAVDTPSCAYGYCLNYVCRWSLSELCSCKVISEVQLLVHNFEVRYFEKRASSRGEVFYTSGMLCPSVFQTFEWMHVVCLPMP